MKTTVFKDKYGTVSSTRTTFGSGDDKISYTKYADGKSGGVALYNKNSVVRLDNRGNTLGHGIKMGNSITYFDKHGGVSNRTPSFV
ncbi:hypothetical protein [Terrisporobacter petrolearius]|uniref:hypothetical protein n=1 Tax=Terrisporobacter petrolearius TaxID=1460447 RepID=UPI0031CCA841